MELVFTHQVHRGTAEIGYWRSHKYWNRGIVTDAVWSIIPFAFDRFPFNRLQAGIFESNLGSMRVLSKCGFCCEAIHKKAITNGGVVMDEDLNELGK